MGGLVHEPHPHQNLQQIPKNLLFCGYSMVTVLFFISEKHLFMMKYDKKGFIFFCTATTISE